MPLKKSISQRTADLISKGVRAVGDFRQAYFYIEEQLYSSEAESVEKFCDWLEENRHLSGPEMPFVKSNYPIIYKNHFLKSIQK